MRSDPPAPRSPRRPVVSLLTLRILAVNLLAVVFLFAGMMYLEEYRRGLIAAELDTLESKAKLFSAAIGESATSPDPAVSPTLIPPLARRMVRTLVEASDLRARLFEIDGALVADSLLLPGPGGVVTIEELPPTRSAREMMKDLLAAYDRLVARLGTPRTLPAYLELPQPTVADYAEVGTALMGKPDHAVRASEDGNIVLSVAVPILRYEQVVGALMLNKSSSQIDDAVLQVRLDILTWFLLALAVTVLLSLYLSGTIARPIKRLANAAERVRRDRHRKHHIPDFGRRSDEIGQLSQSLREMTEALWLRMDAIEQFAADVSHEIKNPLSSLRSAVETAARVQNAADKERLMAIILQDVGRLDRLITDISDASRLDAELSRAHSAPVDLGRMLETIFEVSEATAANRRARLRLDLRRKSKLRVNGIEDRLVQVFRNLITNALSFSPPGGTITLKAARENGLVIAEVLDEGPGIPEGQERDIFTRFYSRRPKGETFGEHSGLGLSISRQIVEAHGGSIYAVNRYGTGGRVAGARFVIELPAA
jgi:two-component system sensor histidine kinase ChvG